MKHNIVRINKIVLSNFKNVKKGIVEMPAYSGKELFSEKADVLGLYGQISRCNMLSIPQIKCNRQYQIHTDWARVFIVDYEQIYQSILL